jgi:hypothetical protein
MSLSMIDFLDFMSKERFFFEVKEFHNSRGTLLDGGASE